MSANRVVVFRLVGGEHEGRWLEVDTGRLAGFRREGDSVRTFRMVPTGNVEWDGDLCAEVYVPEDRLAEWRAEHDVEPA